MRGKWTYRALEEIRRLRGELARGWVIRVEKAADRGQGYLSRILSGEIQRLDIEMLFCLFEHAVLDPRAFMRRLGFDVSSANPLHYLSRVKGQGVHDAGLEILEAAVAVLAERPQPEDALSDGLSEVFAELDELLFSYPTAARRRVDELLKSSSVLRSRLVLVKTMVFYAELCICEERLGVAARSLRLALGVIDSTEHARAEILRVLCLLAVRHAWLPVGEDFVREATELCLLADDRPGIGKMLLTRAVILRSMKEPRHASSYFKKSLDYLADDDWCSRALSHQGSGWCHAQLGQWGEARQALEQAAAGHRTKMGKVWNKILWLRGDVTLEQGDLVAAEEILRAVVEGLSEDACPLDRTLGILQLARVLFLLQEPDELVKLAPKMIRLLTPLQDNEKASAAVAELITAIEAGKVTVKLLDESKRQLEEARSEGSAQK